MENDVSDRLWDRDVQEFIEACKHEKLGDISLGYTVMSSGRKFLNVKASFGSRRRGVIPIGYRWAESRRLGWLPEVFVGQHTSPASHHAAAFRKVVVQAGLWRERRDLLAALQAVTHVFFRAQQIRGDLDREHLKSCPDEISAHDQTLQTLNDLAFLYSNQ